MEARSSGSSPQDGPGEDRGPELTGAGVASTYLERRISRRGLRPRVAASVIATVWLVAIVVFGVVEHLVDRESFPTVWSGLWWATQTVTTVGYGDIVPGQPVGQIIATFLLIGGLSLFAVITATITSAFVARARPAHGTEDGEATRRALELMRGELADLRTEIAALRGHDAAAPEPPQRDG